MEERTSFQNNFECLNCGERSFLCKYTGFDRLHGIPGKFKILECTKCGLFSISPKLIPQEISVYYPENYFCYLTAVEDETGLFRYLDRWRARERRVKQILKRSKGQGRILDVGCSTGILLSGMQRHGWECYGVEPDLKAVDYACKRFGLEVFHGYLEDAAFPDDYFDVVTMIDVLEHIYDPLSTLKEVNRIVKHDGIFIGNLPNADACERFLFEPYWVGWDVPRHYNVYTRKTIRQLLEAQGFKDVELFSFTGRHGAFMLSFEFWMDERRDSLPMKKLINYIMGSLPFRMIMLPFFILLERFNKSTYLSFSARKI